MIIIKTFGVNLNVILKIQNHTGVNEYKLENLQTVSFGRSSKADLKIPDELLSGVHLKLHLNFPRLLITDLESKNGTYLNGIRIEQSDVFVGDEIRVGGTKITIAGDKMEKLALNALTFPGALNERAHHELRPDFTGVREINQVQKKSQRRNPQSLSSFEKEILIRKRANSKIRLTKHEIKLADKTKSTFASSIDTLLILISFATPLMIINLFMMNDYISLGRYKLPTLFMSTFLTSGFFCWFNFKWLKFTLGEKIAGVEKVYRNQDLDLG